MLKQINNMIINTDSIEQIYFKKFRELVLRTNSGDKTYFFINLKDEIQSIRLITELNELLHDPRVTFIDLNDLIED
jgi:hypothetical protein